MVRKILIGVEGIVGEGVRLARRDGVVEKRRREEVRVLPRSDFDRRSIVDCTRAERIL